MRDINVYVVLKINAVLEEFLEGKGSELLSNFDKAI